MNKTMLWLGAGLVVLGGGAFLIYVLPWIAGGQSSAALTATIGATGPSALAVVVATFGLAVGAALVGIGLGRWKRPRPSRYDGSPEV
jgi:FtsH-binding integral membrane protein